MVRISFRVYQRECFTFTKMDYDEWNYWKGPWNNCTKVSVAQENSRWN